MKVKIFLKEVNQILLSKSIKNILDFNSESHRVNKHISNDFVIGNSNIIYTSGCVIIQNDYKAETTTKQIYTVNEPHIQLSLSINGELTNIKQDTEELIKDKHIQVSFRPSTHLELELQPSLDYKHIHIFISKEYFLETLKHEGWTTSDPLYQRVLKDQYIYYGQMQYNFNYSILNIITQIIASDFDKTNMQYCLQNKFRELFFYHHIESTKKDQEQPNTELKSLHEAKNYLQLNYKNPPTIQELSKKIFLNEFKLKKGFKEQFNTTIRQFVINVRMQKALELLDKNMLVNDIAFELGYKSTSHFITNFKKHMGYTPSKVFKK